MRSRHLPGLPVLTLDSGTTIGRINRSVVDPEKSASQRFWSPPLACGASDSCPSSQFTPLAGTPSPSVRPKR